MQENLHEKLQQRVQSVTLGQSKASGALAVTIPENLVKKVPHHWH